MIQLDIHIYTYILFQILFHYKLLQVIECSSLSYTVGPCCLSILYIVVYICSSFKLVSLAPNRVFFIILVMCFRTLYYR